jgi:hypothetical protein
VPSTALRWLGRERRAIGQHPTHDDGEFAGQRYRGFLHPCPLGDPHRPAPQAGADFERPGQHEVTDLVEHRTHRAVPVVILHVLPAYSPELNPQENLWDEIRGKIFKNYALKSMDEVYAKLEETALDIERNPTIVKSVTSSPTSVSRLILPAAILEISPKPDVADLTITADFP